MRPPISIQSGPVPSYRQRFSVAADRPRIPAAFSVVTSCGRTGFGIKAGCVLDIVTSHPTACSPVLAFGQTPLFGCKQDQIVTRCAKRDTVHYNAHEPTGPELILVRAVGGEKGKRFSFGLIRVLTQTMTPSATKILKIPGRR